MARAIALDFTDDERAAFWKRVKARPGVKECWLLRGLKPGEYGAHPHRGQQVPSHRLAYAMSYGVDPGERMVLHGCDDERCQNPRHMRLGSGADNADDRMVASMMRQIVNGWPGTAPRLATRLPGIRMPRPERKLDADGRRIDRRRFSRGKAGAISGDGAQSIRWCYWNGCRDQVALAASHAVTELVVANVLRRESRGHLPPVPGEPDPSGEIARRAARWESPEPDPWTLPVDDDDDHVPTVAIQAADRSVNRTADRASISAVDFTEAA